MGRKSARRMTRAEFELATSHMTMADSLKIAAYMFLVENIKLSEIAESSGHKQQSIQRKVRAIWLSHQSSADTAPEGWVTEEVSLPPEEMKFVQKLSSDLRVILRAKNENN